jgi:hypothetical protein
MISKLSDLLLWQLWQAKIQLRVQSLEKLKEALWSPTSQGSNLCIDKKSKVRNGRRKISESSSATSNLFVEACCWLNDDKQKRNSNQEMAYQETLHELNGRRPTDCWFPEMRLQWPPHLPTHTCVVHWSACFACAIAHSVVGLFRVLLFPDVRVFVLVLPKDFSTPPQQDLVFLFWGWGILFVCVCVLD